VSAMRLRGSLTLTVGLDRLAAMPAPRIVVVEDEAGVRALWVDALEDAGYAVRHFALGAEALAQLAVLKPDLILLDMMMPGMDGYEFLARLRTDPSSGAIPLLIISALGDSLSLALDERSARTLGVVGILPKPLDLVTLLEHVRRVVGPARA
jgi:CheY-like chemotaxis protein